MDTHSQLRIAQFNIQSVVNKKPLLVKFLQEHNVDICLLNETWLKNSHRFHIPGYNLHFKNASNEHGGVAILIRPQFKYKPLATTFYDDVQSVAISLTTENGNLSILCVYCPPSSGHIRINKLRNIVNDLPKPIFIAGDFNAHHIAFGCLSSKGRGHQLYDIIDELDLCILNNGSYTTIHYPNTNPSAIDVSLSSPSVAPLCNWSVHDDSMGSYHFPTFTDISLAVDKYRLNPPIDKFLYNKTDWNRYCDVSESFFSDIVVDADDPLQSYNIFCNQLEALKKECIPKFTRSNSYKSRPPAPWWNKKCEDAVIASYNSLKYYRQNPTISNFIAYKRLVAVKKRTISEEKKNGWRQLCDTFNRTTPVSRIWNHIKMFKGVRKKNKSYDDSFIPSFLDKLSDTCINVDNLNSYFNLNNNCPHSRFLLDPFTLREFYLSLQTRRNTTPGLDDFPYILIKNLHPSVHKLFLEILNALWLRQIIPESWRTQCVIPVLKLDKPPEDCNSYRPISLSSCLGKIFENMIKIRLDWFAESNGLIPHVQYGFRRGRSCADSFVSLISDLKYNKNYASTVAVFLDVQGAFDNVQPGILVKILSGLGIPGLLCKWIYNFLSERILYVKYNNFLYGPRTASKGTMQGATLSPLLYNLYTSEICKYVINDNVNILQFADDIVVYSIHKNLDMAIISVNSALCQLHSYYEDKLNLKINPNKSNVMIFSKDVPNFQVTYNNDPISIVDSHKFLGVIIDKNLTFESHIKHIMKNSLNGLNILRCLAGVSWGADPKVLSMLYKSIVRSHFDYSCLAYLDSSHVNKLNLVQNKALRVILGAMCSTPIRAMEVEAAILPLCLRRLYLAKRFCVKVIASDNRNLIRRILPHTIQYKDPLTTGDLLLKGKFPRFCQIFLEMQERYKLIFNNVKWPCYFTDYSSLIFPVQIVKEKVNNNMELLEFLSINQHYYRLYTDGSKGQEHVRSAVYDPQSKFARSFVLNTSCSIFTAEVFAVFEAMKHIGTVNFCKYFLIITDSLSLVQSLEYGKLHFKANYLVFRIKKLLCKYSQKGITVSFMWVPSHKGITGNEIADRTANEGINPLDVSSLYIPFTDCYPSLKADIKRLWHSFWKKDQEVKGKWFGNIQDDLPAKPWYDDLKEASRDFITTINRLRLGHSTTPAHLCRLKIFESSACEKCQHDFCDVDHLIFSCPAYSLERLILASELCDVNLNNYSSRRLSDYLKVKECYKPIYKYIKSTVQKL